MIVPTRNAGCPAQHSPSRSLASQLIGDHGTGAVWDPSGAALLSDVPPISRPGLLLRSPFRGSAARASGLVSPGVLRGPRFRRLFPDVYLAADVEVTLIVRARAAYLLVEGRGAVGGYAAAELLGASCGPKDAPVDLVVPGGAYRPHPGLTIHRGLLAPDEITTSRSSPSTPAEDEADPSRAVVRSSTLWPPPPDAPPTTWRAAFRWSRRWWPSTPSANAHRFDPAAIAGLRQRHLGARGSAQLDRGHPAGQPRCRSPRWRPGSGSIIVFDGLPVPVLQHPVGPYFLDMAYPAIRLAIEYDGDAHRTQERAMRDLTRQAYLS